MGGIMAKLPAAAAAAAAAAAEGIESDRVSEWE